MPGDCWLGRVATAGECSWGEWVQLLIMAYVLCGYKHDIDGLTDVSDQKNIFRMIKL